MIITTDFPIAVDSHDHIEPRGIKQDNTKCPAFLRACRRLYAFPSLIDIGCAGGGIVKEFIDAGFLAVGIDGSDYAKVNGLGEWPNIPDSLYTADITRPLRSALKAKVVSAWEVMEHIKEQDLGAFFLNLHGLLDDDGVFVASIATFPDGPWHVNLHDRSWWEARFEEAGFVSIHEPLFQTSEMARGSGNPQTSADWTGAENGFHLVCMKRDGQYAVNGTRSLTQRYVIGSGYVNNHCEREPFFRIWEQNLMDNPLVLPRWCYLSVSRGDFKPKIESCFRAIQTYGDLGHICREAGSQRHQLEGWAADVILLAMLAYENECDFLFIEQDCLPFGNFVDRLYDELGSKKLIFGSNSWMPSAQSLFLVKHDFIPEFIRFYLCKKVDNWKSAGEDIFKWMQETYSDKCVRMSFGYDRDRPPGGIESMKPGDVWYIQQISIAEIAKLRECGHIV